MTGLSVDLMKLKAFIAGRRADESRKPNAVLKPSSSMENKAKFTEKRLSMN
jgi:hypothetical protein